MELYNFSAAERNAIKTFYVLVAQVPEGDDAMITLRRDEYRYVLKHLGLKKPSFWDILCHRTPTYRGIRIYERPGCK